MNQAKSRVQYCFPRLLKRPLLFSLGLAMALIAEGASLTAKADTVYLYNGHMIENCKIKEVVGDLIYFKTKGGKRHQVNRMEVNGNMDYIRVRLFSGKDVDGRLLYMNPYTIEVETDMGRTRFLRFRIRQITIGQPTKPQETEKIIFGEASPLSKGRVPAKRPEGASPGTSQKETMSPIQGQRRQIAYENTAFSGEESPVIRSHGENLPATAEEQLVAPQSQKRRKRRLLEQEKRERLIPPWKDPLHPIDNPLP